jgi:uncharacterized protein YjbJ (UPF0337 family)
MDGRTDDLKGRIKEGVGAATDNRDLEREGKLDRAGAAVKDKVGDAVDAVKDAAKKDDRRS